MDEKTTNAVMEDITVLYETKPHLKINDYYIVSELAGVIIHFDTFGSIDSVYLNGILDRYSLISWVVLHECSIDGDTAVLIY